MKSDAIIGAVQGVTKKWAKQRKREERDRSARLNREYVMMRRYHISIREADIDGLETLSEVTGVNWSPGIINPFRELGHFGQSLDTILSQQRADRDEPVILVLHMACPRVEYTDRGKSSVVVQS